MADTLTLLVDQLQVGHYVHIDLKWTDHPFTFSRFKIKSEAQLQTIRSLGLKTIRVSPELSDVAVPMTAAAQDSSDAPMPSLEPSAEIANKRSMLQQMQKRRTEIERVELSFAQTAQAIRDIEKNLYSKPAETVQEAARLVTQITEAILSAPELAIHVMGDKAGGEDPYLHSLNVTMLSMMMARDLKLPIEVAGVLGMGALMHDVGLKEVPDKILLKTEPLTQAERRFFELHCEYGVAIGHKLHLASTALRIIREHHELFDGTGYPAKLKGESIHLLSRIVTIANYYDELCNPPLVADALTPNEALSHMFARLRDKFDPKLLQAFIRCLGVYPPGTMVQLSNGSIGMVSTINTARPTLPAVVVYDLEVPKEEALMFDLATQSDITVVKALAPSDVSAAAYRYLSPRKRVNYFFEATGLKPKPGTQTL